MQESWPQASLNLVAEIQRVVPQSGLASYQGGQVLLQIADALNTTDPNQPFCGVVGNRRPSSLLRIQKIAEPMHSAYYKACDELSSLWDTAKKSYATAHRAALNSRRSVSAKQQKEQNRLNNREKVKQQIKEAQGIAKAPLGVDEHRRCTCPEHVYCELCQPKKCDEAEAAAVALDTQLHSMQPTCSWCGRHTCTSMCHPRHHGMCVRCRTCHCMFAHVHLGDPGWFRYGRTVAGPRQMRCDCHTLSVLYSVLWQSVYQHNCGT